MNLYSLKAMLLLAELQQRWLNIQETLLIGIEQDQLIPIPIFSCQFSLALMSSTYSLSDFWIISDQFFSVAT